MESNQRDDEKQGTMFATNMIVEKYSEIQNDISVIKVRNKYWLLRNT